VSDAELRRLFESVNGLIFPGGLTDLYPKDPYTVAAGKLYAWAKASQDEAGVPFPIWGTCLGHQLLCVLESGAHFQDLFIDTDAVSHPAPLNFTAAAPASRLLEPLFTERPALAAAMGTSPINMENHEFGLPPAAMGPASPWPALAAGFRVLATAVDRGGVPYVATMEHVAYPFFGTQWHPEKPPFEFSDRTIPKSHAAMSVSHYLADRFLDFARAVPHAPASPEQELADLIYNTKPVFTAREIVMEASYDGEEKTGPEGGCWDGDGGWESGGWRVCFSHIPSPCPLFLSLPFVLGPDITYFFDKDQAPREESE
jgi:gamma-glutamyl hydrolase